MKFQELNISDEIKKAVKDLGYEEATPIQEKSIPAIMEGKDVIGFSQTGSGKTASFGIPAIELVDMTMNKKLNQVLILCPTRELALQAAEELRKFAKYIKGLNVVSIFGGQNIERQFKHLREGSHIVVGTPGRVMDHIRRKSLKLEQLKMVVLDEADEMLNMGFREDIETILKDTPDDRQTILFSATMPKEILDITNNYQKNPELIKIKNKQMTVDSIEQRFYLVDKNKKKSATALLLRYYRPKLAIIFCNTKRMVDELVDFLGKNKFLAQGLHGDVKQQQRTNVMNQFKKGTFNILVATDVAARGIDVNNLDIVINYDLPEDNEYYVHRIGRTGRAGNEGKSFTLIDGRRELEDLRYIERYAKCEIIESKLPTVDEIKTQDYQRNINRLKKFMDKHDSSNQKEIVEMLIEEGYSLEKITLALMDMMNRKNNDYSGLSDVKPLVIVRKERKNKGIGRNNKSINNRRTEKSGNEKQTEKGRKNKYNRKNSEAEKKKYNGKNNESDKKRRKKGFVEFENSSRKFTEKKNKKSETNKRKNKQK